MFSPRRFKGLFVLLAAFFLVCFLYSFSVSDKRLCTSPTASDSSVASEKTAANINIIALTLKGLNQTLSKFVSRFHHEANTKRATTKPTSKSTSKPTAKSTSKPSIDIVNDYYPFVDFKFVFPEIIPKVETTPNIFMIVLVNSGAKGDEFRKRREAIRQTWGNRENCEHRKASQDERLKDLRWLLVFVVGKAGTGTNDDELNMAEARQHNDMLIGNITDNYINNVIKVYMGQVWASRFDIKYTMKTDDDVYVRIPRVLEYLVNAKFPRPFYGGRINPPSKVDRKIDGKWAISYKYFDEAYFPRMNYGGFFILSSDLLGKLTNYVYKRKPFHVDDAYVGVAMRDFDIKPSKIESFHLVQREPWRARLRTLRNCEILSWSALGHTMSPRDIKGFHERFESLVCTDIPLDTEYHRCITTAVYLWLKTGVLWLKRNIMN